MEACEGKLKVTAVPNQGLHSKTLLLFSKILCSAAEKCYNKHQLCDGKHLLDSSSFCIIFFPLCS